MIEGEEAGGQLMITNDVENYPGFEHGVTGPELIAVMRKQAEKFGTRFLTRNVTKVDFTKRPFKVYVGNDLYESQTIIISTGASAKYLGLPSEKQYMSRGVSACATCDGAFFRNMEVIVIGGGDTAMEEANFLTRFATKVYLVHRSETFRASKIMLDRARKNPKIEFVMNTSLVEVLGDGKSVTGAKLKNNVSGEVIDKPIHGVFIAIGHQPNTKLFKDILDMNEAGYLVTQAGTTYTNIPGVFAAGDVQDPVYRQAVTAAGTGCMAAIDCERWLEANEAH
jgi:thioredoxin reductase (NADPH)